VAQIGDSLRRVAFDQHKVRGLTDFVAVLSAGRANYNVLGIRGWFGEIAQRRLCARSGGEQCEKSKKEGEKGLRNEAIGTA
jgi:hypothetical protein